MGLQLDYEITDKDINWKISIFGTIFLCFRIYFMSVFILEDGSFHPEVFHASYIISIFVCLSMVFSFRVKGLNVVALTILPSIIFTIPFHDIPLLIDPGSSMLGSGHEIGGLLWWNFLTVHTPIPVVAFYTYMTRKETLSIPSVLLMFPIGISWFIFLDDKENGTLDGDTYVLIFIILMAIWGSILIFGILKDTRGKDPLIAPVLEWKKLKWVSKSDKVFEETSEVKTPS